MNESFLEKLEAFLEGDISREELEKLAEEAGVDNLDAELEWFKDSRLAIEATGLRQQLQEVLPKPAKKEAKVVRLKRFRMALAVAASVLVIVVAYFGFFREGDSGLYAEYEYVDPGLPVLMSQSEQYELYDALTYYSEGDYVQTEQKLQAIAPDYPNNDTLTYYLGASQLYQGKTEAARAALEIISNRENSRFQQRADWLLVLAALKEKDQTSAQEFVQNILDIPGHAFREQAQSLQADLND